MRTMRAVLFSLALALTGCTVADPIPVATVAEEPYVPGPTLDPNAVLHADSAFTPDERIELQTAAELWRLQTSGVANIYLVYDLHFDGVEYDVEDHVAAGDHIVVRGESWLPWVQAEDGPDGALMLGLVSPQGGIHNPRRKPLTVVFVADRMGVANRAGESLTQVALHEFGHVLGAPHIEGGIMAPSAFKADHVCLKKSDIVGFCKANVRSCGKIGMYPCD